MRLQAGLLLFVSVGLGACSSQGRYRVAPAASLIGEQCYLDYCQDRGSSPQDERVVERYIEGRRSPK